MINSSPAPSRKPRSAVESVLILTAVAALLLGGAVYIIDRDWTYSLLLEPFASYQWPRSNVFGGVGDFLPSLLHAYAISVLLIVALWPWPRKWPWVCLLWFSIASLLEWLQCDAAGTFFVDSDKSNGVMLPLKYLERYATYGKFDYIDLLATGVGCLTALTLSIAVMPNRQRIYI